MPPSGWKSPSQTLVLYTFHLDSFFPGHLTIAMLFFRRRDTALSQSNLTDQERCIHACIFFDFIILVVTIVLFYFAATHKGSNEQRIYYYIGAGISLALLLLVIFCTIVYVRRFYSDSFSPTAHPHPHTLTSTSEHDNSRYSYRHA